MFNFNSSPDTLTDQISLSYYNRPEFYNPLIAPNIKTAKIGRLRIRGEHGHSSHIRQNSREVVRPQVITEIEKINKTMAHNDINISVKTLEKAYHVPDSNNNVI